MRSFITIGLVVVMLFVAGPAFAALDQPVPCPNPQIVTDTTYYNVFAGPKMGWLKAPVEKKTLVCRDYKCPAYKC
jgi:hypothetical protein